MCAMRSEIKVMHQIGAKHWSRLLEAASAELASGGTDAAIAFLAAHQHDMLARWELLALGVERGAIRARLAGKRLHPVHRAVYSLSPRVRTEAGAFIAAVLALGPDAVVARRGAGAHWGIRPSAGPRVEVISPRSLPRRSRIVPVRALLPDDEWTIHDGIPVTTVPRTILDLAAVLPRAQLEQCLERAEALRLRDTLSVADLLTRYPGARGSRKLRTILVDEAIGGGITREELEAAFHLFVDECGFPKPEINAPLSIGPDSFVADFLWRKARLIVELDGYATHGTRQAFERDRRRDRRLQAAGWRPIRVTWRHLHREREELSRDIAAMLAGC
jgi:hypothetical protein